MSEAIGDTSERIVPGRQVSLRQRLLYLRHLFAYEYLKSQLPSSARVIEVGCGEGYGADLLSRHVARVVGLDVDERVVGQAVQRYASKSCDFRTYDGRTIPFPDGHFDTAVSLQVIEHIDDDTGFLTEIARVLEGGGVFYATTPNRLIRVAPGEKPWNKHHVREYSPPEFESLLGTVFCEVRVQGVRATEEAERIELQRIRSIRRMAAIDPLQLRHRLPESLKQWIGRLVESRARDDASARVFGVEDFRASEDEVERSLDLLATCRKAR